MYRQGDVLLVRLSDSDVEKLERKQPVAAKNGRIVLLDGEATGHAHVLPTDRVNGWWETDRRKGRLMIIEVKKTAALTHEEHDTIDIPPGIYIRIRQREYSPMRSIHYVRD